jgi:hypothetical protein
MADDELPFYAPNAKPRPPREPVPGEPLWTLHKLDGRIDCELRSHGPWGWEVQLYRNGGFYAGRRFELREHALAHADELRADLCAMGWSSEQ